MTNWLVFVSHEFYKKLIQINFQKQSCSIQRISMFCFWMKALVILSENFHLNGLILMNLIFGLVFKSHTNLYSKLSRHIILSCNSYSRSCTPVVVRFNYDQISLWRHFLYSTSTCICCLSEATEKFFPDLIQKNVYASLFSNELFINNTALIL